MEVCTPKLLDEFLKALRNNKTDSITDNNINNEVGLITYQGVTTFHLAKSESGTTGSANLTLKNGLII